MGSVRKQVCMRNTWAELGLFINFLLHPLTDLQGFVGGDNQREVEELRRKNKALQDELKRKMTAEKPYEQTKVMMTIINNSQLISLVSH